MTTSKSISSIVHNFRNAAQKGEMGSHFSAEEHHQGNRRNDKLSKQVQTMYGEVTVENPRDRDCTFAPQTIRKRETILAEGMADQIIGMYAFGTSTREISKYFEREFDTSLSGNLYITTKTIEGYHLRYVK